MQLFIKILLVLLLTSCATKKVYERTPADENAYKRQVNQFRSGFDHS